MGDSNGVQETKSSIRHRAEVSVPEPLEIDKYNEPVHVFTRKPENAVEIIGLK